MFLPYVSLAEGQEDKGMGFIKSSQGEMAKAGSLQFGTIIHWHKEERVKPSISEP